MDLSVVIISWNTKGLLMRCLESVLSEGERLSLEILVVDNASSDGSAGMVRDRFPQVHLIANEENVGFARANNQAIDLASGRYILLLNSDTEVCTGALWTLVEFMDRQPRAGAVGARLLNTDGSLQPSCHPMLTPWREFWRLLFLERVKRCATYDMAHWDLQSPRRVEVIKGACLLSRREALERVGSLDERYFMYTEEVDLCYRLQAADWELYWAPQARVVHHEGQSSRQMRESMYIQLYRSKVLFFRKHGKDRRARLFKHLLRIAYLPRAAGAAVLAPFSAAWMGRVRLWRRLLSELPSM